MSFYITLALAKLNCFLRLILRPQVEACGQETPVPALLLPMSFSGSPDLRFLNYEMKRIEYL